MSTIDRTVSRWTVLRAVEHRLLIQKKWFKSILLFGIGNPTLYLLSIGLGIGSLVDANTTGVDGVKYLTFLAPALLANAAIQSAMTETMFPAMAGFIWAKTFFGIRSTPISGKGMAMGIWLSAILQVTFTTGIYWVILWLFGAMDHAGSWLSLITAIYGGLAVGAVMLFVASLIDHDDGFLAIVNRFVMMPMFLFSGTFYPLTTLPLYVRWIGWASPLWHSTELGRWASYGHSIPGTIALIHIAYLGLWISLGLYFARRKFNQRLAK
jgi:lipooligosaccharide transport system permease protein